ncbi:hypothetical protein [Pelagerythrobacter sp.]|uniref:hypothetical protein n=1 Tax=Pelagerythrobacter sp. TaxID=2800702 RepID=UPI0035AED391
MNIDPTSAIRLSSAINEVEETIDQAALRTTDLINEIINTRVTYRSHEAAVYAQPALKRAQQALAQLSAAQDEIAHSHAALRNAHRVVAGPEHPTCPDAPQKVFTGAELQNA